MNAWASFKKDRVKNKQIWIKKEKNELKLQKVPQTKNQHFLLIAKPMTNSKATIHTHFKWVPNNK